MTATNINDAEFSYDSGDPAGYRAAEGSVGGQPVGVAAGARQLAVRLFEIPTGESLCPYHYEYSEEWLLVISGTLDLRTPAGTEPIAAGALACFPAGPEGGHKVTATSAEPARIMMWSRQAQPEVVVYPDSDKISVFTGNQSDNNLRFHRADGAVDYYDGEI